MSTPAGQTALRDRTAYQALEEHPEGLFLDYSKNRVTDETLRLLVELAEQSGLRVDVLAGEHRADALTPRSSHTTRRRTP